MNRESKLSFEYLYQSILHTEMTQMVAKLKEPHERAPKKYLTINEVSTITGIGTYTIRQLTFSRAMPHRKIKSRIIFDEVEITESISNYKEHGWSDPSNHWDVTVVQSQIDSLRNEKEEPPLIEEIFRKLIKDELEIFSREILNYTKKEKENYYGRTILNIKEAAEHFRTSPSTIYSLIKDEGMPHLKMQSRYYVVLEEAEAYLWRETAKSYALEGNIYWQRILQRLDWEENERNSAYEKALERLREKI